MSLIVEPLCREVVATAAAAVPVVVFFLVVVAAAAADVILKYTSVTKYVLRRRCVLHRPTSGLCKTIIRNDTHPF